MSNESTSTTIVFILDGLKYCVCVFDTYDQVNGGSIKHASILRTFVETNSR